LKQSKGKLKAGAVTAGKIKTIEINRRVQE
jgi:hypothetical protein